jgi:hypothetical protein
LGHLAVFGKLGAGTQLRWNFDIYGIYAICPKKPSQSSRWNRSDSGVNLGNDEKCFDDLSWS